MVPCTLQVCDQGTTPTLAGSINGNSRVACRVPCSITAFMTSPRATLRVATHPKLRSNFRDRAGQFPDLAACFNPGAPRDQLSCQDRRVGLSPGLGSALDLSASPPSFHPNQADRATKTRQVTNLDRHPTLRLSPAPAP